MLDEYDDDSMNFTTEETTETTKSILLIEVSRLTSAFSLTTKYPSEMPSTSNYLQIVEIFLLILIFIEQVFLFILTCQKSRTNENEMNSRSIVLPVKSFLYSCLHRNWIRAFSLGNLCLSLTYFSAFLFKYFKPDLINKSKITFSLLSFTLTEGILINFNSFHLLIISLTVGQYFLRYERLLKTSYYRHFFNGQSLLISKHTNVALILSGSLALIFAYNSTFYIPRSDRETSVLTLVTFNMILLPLINFVVFLVIFIYLLKTCFDRRPSSIENETLRFYIAKSSCTKCYEKILEQNASIFQDKENSNANLYGKFSSNQIGSICSSTSKDNDFLRQTFLKLEIQHQFCHLSHKLLLIFLLKYSLLTSPIYLDEMFFYLKDFSHSIVGPTRQNDPMIFGFYDSNQRRAMIYHCLFLLSRLGDVFLLTRFPSWIRKYFPCSFRCDAKLCRQNDEIFSNADVNIEASSTIIENELRQKTRRRFQLKFRYVPLCSSRRGNFS